MKIKTGKITFLGLATAFALVLSYFEMLLPPIVSAVPGIKMGLPNVVIIFLIYKVSLKSAAAVSIVRVLVATLLFGNFMTLSFSLAGAVLSIAVMALIKKSNRFSMVGTSVAGAVSHNLGQIVVAMLILQTKEIGYYMIVLAVTGIVTGVIIGLAGTLLIKYSNRIKI